MCAIVCPCLISGETILSNSHNSSADKLIPCLDVDNVFL